MGSGNGSRSWEAEWMVLLRFTILRMSLWESGATYGATLQNLIYRNEFAHSDGRLSSISFVAGGDIDGFFWLVQSTAVDSGLTRFQLNAYTALAILPTYLHTRLQDTLLTSTWSSHPLPRSPFSLLNPFRLLPSRRRSDFLSPTHTTITNEYKRLLYESLQLSEKLGQIIGLVNFLIFLWDGRFRGVVERVLGMRMAQRKRDVGRNVSFEFLSRQLVWEAFTVRSSSLPSSPTTSPVPLVLRTDPDPHRLNRNSSSS